jgi:outer membrane protein
MKKLIFLILFCSLLGTPRSFGQDSYLTMQYAVSFATGDMSDYISAVSWRGFLMEYRGEVNDHLLLGVDVGWNVFYEKKEKDTYTVGTESLSGVQYRYQNEVPMLGTLDYLISSEGPVLPYVGLGIGTIYSERATDMNLYRLEQNTWQFALKGEVGVLYELSYASSIKLAAKYYNGFKTGTLENQGYFSISLGMAWTL